MWRFLVVALLGVLILAGCGGSEVPVTSDADQSEEVQDTPGSVSEPSDSVGSAPVCEGEEPVPIQVQKDIDDALEEHSGILGVVCVGALQDPPFVQVHVVVNRKAGVGQPVQEVEDSIDFEQKDGSWQGYVSFSWSKTDRQEQAERTIAEARLIAGQTAVAQEHARDEAAQDSFLLVLGSQIKSGSVTWDGSTTSSGLPTFQLILGLEGLNIGDLSSDPYFFNTEVLIRLSDGQELLYRSGEVCCSSFENPEPGKLFYQVPVAVAAIGGTVQYQQSEMTDIALGATVKRVRLVEKKSGVSTDWIEF